MVRDPDTRKVLDNAKAIARLDVTYIKTDFIHPSQASNKTIGEVVDEIMHQDDLSGHGLASKIVLTMNPDD